MFNLPVTCRKNNNLYFRQKRINFALLVHYIIMENLEILVKELCKLPSENGWVEFKHNNCDPEMVGKDISALANSAVINDRQCAYMIWGVDDCNHDIIGTNVRLNLKKKGDHELESWLRFLLSKNANFEFKSLDINGLHIEMIIISKAAGLPVTFEKNDYIRVGSYTKKLSDYPALQVQLWDKLRHEQFEDVYAATNLQINDIVNILNCNAYFELLHLPIPTNLNGYAHYLEEDNIITKQDNGLYAITNMGAVLFAKKLQDFSRLGRKAMRVVKYEDNSRLTILKEESFTEGYASSIEKVVRYIDALLPSREDVNSIRRQTEGAYPLPAIREAVANAVIHQDFFVTGAGPVVEIFTNRIEVTNPGIPLVEIIRIVDNPPKSRNEKLAALMRRLGMCEELGRGWDRMVISCEMMRLPAPRIQIYQDSTKVSLFSHLDFSNIPLEDKVWSAYLHACIKYIEGNSLTNSSLRERFGLKDTSSGMVSRLIKEALAQRLIKSVDSQTAPRYMKYIPVWA